MLNTVPVQDGPQSPGRGARPGCSGIHRDTSRTEALVPAPSLCAPNSKKHVGAVIQTESAFCGVSLPGDTWWHPCCSPDSVLPYAAGNRTPPGHLGNRCHRSLDVTRAEELALCCDYIFLNCISLLLIMFTGLALGNCAPCPCSHPVDLSSGLSP